MNPVIASDAEKISDAPSVPHPRRSVPSPARHIVQPGRRSLGRLFRRQAPTAFHRCLAVHMHFAAHSSALES
jgi:hypothetical protein